MDDAGGDGPGSFDVRGSVWHLDCCNPENKLDGQGWSIFNALFGWTNSATREFLLSFFPGSKFGVLVADSYFYVLFVIDDFI